MGNVQDLLTKELAALDHVIKGEKERQETITGWLDESRALEQEKVLERQDLLSHMEAHGWKPDRCDEGCPLIEDRTDTGERVQIVYRCAEHGWMGSAVEEAVK